MRKEKIVFPDEQFIIGSEILNSSYFTGKLLPTKSLWRRDSFDKISIPVFSQTKIRVICVHNF